MRSARAWRETLKKALVTSEGLVKHRSMVIDSSLSPIARAPCGMIREGDRPLGVQSKLRRGAGAWRLAGAEHVRVGGSDAGRLVLL